MKTKAWTWVLLPLAAAVSWAIGVGCENTAGDCVLTAECTGGTGIAPSTECDPNKANAALDDSCGVFVSSSFQGDADGTRSKPFATFKGALDAAKTSGITRVYACAETFDENVELSAGITVYGGLDCTQGWKLSTGSRTTLSTTKGIPITFAPGKTTHVENLAALAPPGAPPDPMSQNPLSGGSSIAALALPSAILELVRCDFEAADGAGGSTEDPPAPLSAAPSGSDGGAACDTGKGGLGAVNMCESDASGGEGGLGADANPALPGQNGAGPEGGKGGAPQLDKMSCAVGGDGISGSPGDAGKGGEPLATLLDPEKKGSPGAPAKAVEEAPAEAAAVEETLVPAACAARAAEVEARAAAGAHPARVAEPAAAASLSGRSTRHSPSRKSRSRPGTVAKARRAALARRALPGAWPARLESPIPETSPWLAAAAEVETVAVAAPEAAVKVAIPSPSCGRPQRRAPREPRFRLAVGERR